MNDGSVIRCWMRFELHCAQRGAPTGSPGLATSPKESLGRWNFDRAAADIALRPRGPLPRPLPAQTPRGEGGPTALGRISRVPRALRQSSGVILREAPLPPSVTSQPGADRRIFTGNGTLVRAPAAAAETPRHPPPPRPVREGGHRVFIAANSFAGRPSARHLTPPPGFCYSRTLALPHFRTFALSHSRTHALTHSRTHALTHSRTSPRYPAPVAEVSAGRTNRRGPAGARRSIVARRMPRARRAGVSPAP